MIVAHVPMTKAEVCPSVVRSLVRIQLSPKRNCDLDHGDLLLDELLAC